jgi:hypothetical protein
MALNLKDPKCLEVFKRRAEQADVVVEKFRPDVKAILGIDFENLRQINPRSSWQHLRLRAGRPLPQAAGRRSAWMWRTSVC